MNSGRSRSDRNSWDPAYRKKQIRSILFLGILSLVLVLSVILSLWAGSYDTPFGDLMRGIFNKLRIIR